MWNPISSTPSGVHQGNVVSTPELQALFQEVLKPGDAGRLAFGIKPAQSMFGVPPTAHDNWILSALTRAEHDALLPHLEPINLQVCMPPMKSSKTTTYRKARSSRGSAS